ncbi:Na/Pi cotransporter family protein [Rhodohalobacter sp. SW132]|uniref:Na/Pi cotransporter family protein n=1 Tax=Rhodohalobacter sp. SW132 TaxID=2293433 RepID=UPI000E25AC4D|nr:Na/Pi symporter [Rhodohalobacter sp. SW132]REL37845.1 Na/Pi cotransporter family protein [Rhodohalobacter sp. SW132]
MAILSEFDLWLFLAGLGIFLFGMHMMEESIRILSGAAFKQLIRKYTATRFKSILSGMVSTAILQSSSAVSLMVLAFTGAGIMNLIQAISVMMGAKIGTTATAWIVAVFGFEFNIDSFSLPLIGIGGLGIILLAKSPKYVNISRFLVAFGFLFMGLDFMKSSVDQISEIIDPEMFAGYGVVVFALVGMVMTAIMQSSSATIAIVLTMLFTGVIDFQAGAAMVVGANVGTTVTVVLGAIGGIHTKKQAALSQLIFTVGTAVVTLLILPLFTWFVMVILGFSTNIVLGLAMFHTLFNVLGVMIYYPFIPKLAEKAEEWIPERVVQMTQFIHKTDPEVSDAAIEAFRKEIMCQLDETLKFARQSVSSGKQPGRVIYTDLEKYHADIFEYYTRIHAHALDEEESKAVDELLRASRNLMNAAKNIQESQGNLLALTNETDLVHKEAFASIQQRLKRMVKTGQKLTGTEDENARREVREEVEDLYLKIERMDKEFIQACSSAVGHAEIRKLQITQLLMINREITQTCRMLIFAMRSILKHEDIAIAA